MVSVSGAQFFGRVDQCSGSFIATEFVALLGTVPLYPLRSYAVLDDARAPKQKRIRLHWRSVLVTYLRSWGLVLAIVLLGWAGVALYGTHDFMNETKLATVAGLALLVEVWSFGRLGQLSRDQKAQRLAYKDLIGYAIDPVFLGPARSEHRRDVREEVLRHARAYAAQGYRDRYDPERQWHQMALDPRIEDPRFMVAAMTLARLEQCYAQAPDKKAYGRAVRAIWRRLRGMAPEYYEAAVYA